MKKLLFLLAVVSCNLNFSQEKKDEIKGDPFYLIAAGALNVSYEKIITDESGVGVSVLLSNGKDINTTFSLTPYYRFYFGKKTAAGFFVEGFSMLEAFKTRKSNYVYSNYYSASTYYEDVNLTDLALGFGLGGKWVTKKGVLFEISTGIGRRLFNDYSGYDAGQIVGRGGIAIGYRF
jgi:hypothetical protein